MTTTRAGKTVRLMSISLTLTLLALSANAAHVVLKNGRKIAGTDIRARANGDVVLTTKRGQQTFAKAQILKAVADKPAAYDKARKLSAAKKFDQAETVLKGIIKEYRNLEWDNRARLLLAQVYLATGDSSKAVSTFDDIFRGSPALKKDPELMMQYAEVLLKAKRYPKLMLILDDRIKNGTREEAAKAQIMRGNVNLDQGKLEPAFLDYMRTVTLFQNQKAEQPEALFRAASVLEQMRDQRRAKELFTKLVTEYPGSPYAAQARDKI